MECESAEMRLWCAKERLHGFLFDVWCSGCQCIIMSCGAESTVACCLYSFTPEPDIWIDPSYRLLDGYRLVTMPVHLWWKPYLFMYLLAARRCQSAWWNVWQIHGIYFTSPPRKDWSIILSHSIWTNRNFSRTVEIVGINASLLIVLIETTV